MRKTALQSFISYKIITTGDGRVATPVSSLVLLNVAALNDTEKRAAPQSPHAGTSQPYCPYPLNITQEVSTTTSNSNLLFCGTKEYKIIQ